MQMKPLPFQTSAFYVIQKTIKKLCKQPEYHRDSDSVGNVAGGILGAKLGIAELPASWTEAPKEKEKLEEMVRNLLEKYFQISDNKMRSLNGFFRKRGLRSYI